MRTRIHSCPSGLGHNGHGIRLRSAIRIIQAASSPEHAQGFRNIHPRFEHARMAVVLLVLFGRMIITIIIIIIALHHHGHDEEHETYCCQRHDDQQTHPAGPHTVFSSGKRFSLFHFCRAAVMRVSSFSTRRMMMMRADSHHQSTTKYL